MEEETELFFPRLSPFIKFFLGGEDLSREREERKDFRSAPPSEMFVCLFFFREKKSKCSRSREILFRNLLPEKMWEFRAHSLMRVWNFCFCVPTPT